MRVKRARDERGAVALLVVAGMTALLVVAAMVLDFGLVRLDRQKVRNGLDAAVMAGLRASDNGTGKIHTQRAVCAALDFLRWVQRGAVLLDSPDATTSLPQMLAIAERFADLPLDLADASIAEAAARLKLRHILSLDSDFDVYRDRQGRPLVNLLRG